jgi:hypothetical protein
VLANVPVMLAQFVAHLAVDDRSLTSRAAMSVVLRIQLQGIFVQDRGMSINRFGILGSLGVESRGIDIR